MNETGRGLTRVWWVLISAIELWLATILATIVIRWYNENPVTNTRDDTIESSFWKKSIEERRCLVPVSSFAEPEDGKPMQWHWYGLEGDEPRPLFAFAGIWRKRKGPVKKDGPTLEIETYSFMTTAANAWTEAIHHDRLPVLLATTEDQDAWLQGKPGEWERLLKPFPPDRMREVQVGLDKVDLMKV